MIEQPIIFDTSDGQHLRINMINSWFKNHYGELGLDAPAKIVKLSLDGGFTCPNRDGSKGIGGCLFCSESGSGDMASSLSGTPGSKLSDLHCGDLIGAMHRQSQLLSEKWPADKAALEAPDVVGLAIATRPDCLPDDVLDLLSELNEKTFLWVELGLQTIHDETAQAMNLCHTLADYDDAVLRLTARGIRVVTHLILGLPGESREMMLESVRYACRPIGDAADSCIFGLKLHMLNVVRGSGMAQTMPDYIPFDSMEEYIDLLIAALEIVPPEITLHRISGDAPRSTLIAPAWSYQKRTILNNIHREMRQRNTWQGRLTK